jgi:dTDP-glucose 4,6-dehydratase
VYHVYECQLGVPAGTAHDKILRRRYFAFFLNGMSDDDTILVTGGAGFIGSHFVRHCLGNTTFRVINLDKLTYAGNLENLSDLASDPKHLFIHGDICDALLVRSLLAAQKPMAVVHLAAETHVDHSISSPDDFIQTNVIGTFALLQETKSYWQSLTALEKQRFRFLHISTDEVYGSLHPQDPPFTENTPYCPNSPYAASKAASDHLTHSFHHTYGLPVVITNCSNNFGPFQFPEKLIPLMIRNALSGESLPVYGDGKNIRDWLYVEDHCEALLAALLHGKPGETYNIGASNEIQNINVVLAICALLDELHPIPSLAPHRKFVKFVEDRPGHDRRYAVDATKIHHDLAWRPRLTFEKGLRKTVEWYLSNQLWVETVRSRSQLSTSKLV